MFFLTRNAGSSGVARVADEHAMTPSHPYQDAPLLVLTGAGRSGTTALHQALGAHPGLDASGYVQNIVHDVLTTALVNRSAPTRRPTMRVSDDEYDALFRRLILDLVFPATQPAPNASVPMLFTNLTRDTADYLGRLFEQARVVVLIRNGVDVVRSRLAHTSLGVHGFESHCRAWAMSAEVCEWAQSEKQALLVRYEDLRRDGANLLNRIENHAGLPHHDAPLRQLGARTYHPTPANSGHEWERWAPAQRKVFEEHCALGMNRLGYTIPWRQAEARGAVAPASAACSP